MAMELWDPLGQAMSLREAMDRWLQDSIIRSSGRRGRRAAEGMMLPEEIMLPLDVHESDDSYTIRASLPGVQPEDIQVQIAGDTVTIRGDIKEEHEERQGQQAIMRERRVGTFMRTLTLPMSVDPERVEATDDNGVLTLQLPKAQQTKQRRIQVRKGGGQRQVEAGSTAQARQDGQGQGQTAQTTQTQNQQGMPGREQQPNRTQMSGSSS